jgi:electron transfer flavoprotein alpha subunit
MVLVFAEASQKVFKKACFEAVSYGAALARTMNVPCTAVVLGDAEQPEQLGIYGASTVYHVADARLNNLNSGAFTKAIVQVAKNKGASVLVFSNNNSAKAVAPRVAAALQAGLVAGAVALPNLEQGFVVKKSVFSGKAFAYVNIQSPIKVISLTTNSTGIHAEGSPAGIEAMSVEFGDRDFAVNVVSVSKVSGTVPLSEAELVVSGGRGLKGPENWGILEALANELGATLACSRPVADSHWRPHHEHVGQTGGTIRPNLYVAVGISGAIQHLAGVNSSKTIVVINKDPEAPFFKAADYGILGDAFDVLPRLTESVKKFKAAQNA